MDEEIRGRDTSGRWGSVARAAAPLAFVACCAFAADAADHASFSGTFTVTVKAPADRALSLFDPVGEAAWAPGWAPVFARDADRASPADGAVFTTRGHGGGTKTWVLQRYDRRAHEIAYTAFDEAGAVFGIRVAVRDRAQGGSEATVRYDLVATTETGDRVVHAFESQFPQMEPHWQAALDAAVLH
jgi:hypothetical protein